MTYIALFVSALKLLLAILDLSSKKGGQDKVAFIGKTTGIIGQLSVAESPEDHQNAAKNLADLVASQPVD